jgi:YegS/Rv2252/BmrU family lipid kinase
VKVRAILNPRAGVSTRRIRAAVERGRPGFTDYAVYLTRAPGHATELAEQAVAGGAEVVLAVGGDGTVNEVARALLGSTAALGIVPVGSGNGLARALHVPLHAGRALDAIEHGVVRAIDVVRVNGRLVLNVAGIGFDAAVARAFHEHGRRGGRRGFAGYLYLSLRELLAYRAPSLVLECGGERLFLRPFVVAIANGPQYGSRAFVNPGARLDDGRLELVVFDEARVPRLLVGAWRMFFGGLESTKGYRRFEATSAVITSGEPLALHVDGDPVARTTRVDVALEPRALRVVVPAHAPVAALAPASRT